MANGYSWINLSTAITQLAQRLNDPSNVFWTVPEITVYIQQAMRQFNSLVFQNKADFSYTSKNLWNSLGTLVGSPRVRTITDTYCYTQMEMMLLEPPTGGTWTGTSQFSINDLSQALQTRRDEMLQVSNCNQILMQGIPVVPNTIRTFLPDTTIDLARVRYLPLGAPAVTLYPDDTVAEEFYQSYLYELSSGNPQTFMQSSEPPLSFDVDIAPNLPGTYEAVVLQTGAPFNPPTDTLIGIPDDFAWTLIWGALADLLGRESEATDRERASYCLRRYQDGMNVLLKTPWVMLAKVNGQAVNIDSIYATDRYSPEWDSTPTSFGPVVVTGGIDFYAAPLGSGIGLTVLGNMPVPVNGSDFLQVSRSDYDIILDLAQSLACFKMAGAEWQASLQLEARAIQACSAENSRLKSLGAFSDILVERGQMQEMDQNRYNIKGQQG